MDEVRIFVNVPRVSTFADIDECKSAENVCVGHGCINLLGSYRCECQAGYIFNSITRVCEGKQSFPPLHRMNHTGYLCKHQCQRLTVYTAVWNFALNLYRLAF